MKFIIAEKQIPWDLGLLNYVIDKSNTKKAIMERYFSKDVIERLKNQKDITPKNNSIIDDYKIEIDIPSDYFHKSPKNINYLICDENVSEDNDIPYSFWHISNVKTFNNANKKFYRLNLDIDMMSTYINKLENNFKGNITLTQYHPNEWKLADNNKDILANYYDDYGNVICDNTCSNLNDYIYENIDINKFASNDDVKAGVLLFFSKNDNTHLSKLLLTDDMFNNFLEYPYLIKFLPIENIEFLQQYVELYESDSLKTWMLKRGITEENIDWDTLNKIFGKLLAYPTFDFKSMTWDKREEIFNQIGSFFGYSLEISYLTILKKGNDENEYWNPFVVKGYDEINNRLTFQDFTDGTIRTPRVLKFNTFNLALTLSGIIDCKDYTNKIENNIYDYNLLNILNNYKTSHGDILNHKKVILNTIGSNYIEIDRKIIDKNNNDIVLNYNNIIKPDGCGLNIYLQDKWDNMTSQKLQNKLLLKYISSSNLPINKDSYLETLRQRKNTLDAQRNNIDIQYNTDISNAKTNRDTGAVNTAMGAASGIAGAVGGGAMSATMGLPMFGAIASGLSTLFNMTGNAVETSNNYKVATRTARANRDMSNNTLNATIADAKNSNANVRVANGELIDKYWNLRIKNDEFNNLYITKYKINKTQENHLNMMRMIYGVEYSKTIKIEKMWDLITKRHMNYVKILDVSKIVKNISSEIAIQNYFKDIFEGGILLNRIDTTSDENILDLTNINNIDVDIDDLTNMFGEHGWL